MWSEFKARPAALKVSDENVRRDLFEGIASSGPKSIKAELARAKYHSPELIDEVFQSAYKVLEEDAGEVYEQISKQKLSAEEVDQKLISAEQYNPEVLHNVRYNKAGLDRSHPVYREYLRKEWESYDKMVTMQRLEQLHVIPDTLSTLEPRVDVRVKFGHNTKAEFADWVTPGTKLPAFAVSAPPTIEIQEFDNVDNTSGLYTVLLVNPDIPDLERNSFKTSLNYGLHNVPLTYNDNAITPGKLLSNPAYIFHQYEPLVPEKNSPTHRACLWVFRQATPLADVDVSPENFDIRAFVAQHNLQPVGAHVWRQDFDRSVNGVRKDHALAPGNVFHPIRGTDPLL